MKTFKEFLGENLHPSLHGHTDAEGVKKYQHWKNSKLDGSGLESRGEKMKHTRAKNAFWNHLNKFHSNDDDKVKRAYIAIDKHFEK